MSTAEFDSVPETENGPSTSKDVTREVSVQDIYNQGARDMAQAGTRPAYVHKIRGESITRAPLMYDGQNISKLDGFEEYGAPCGLAVSALDGMKAAIDAVVSARTKSQQDPTLPSEASQVLKVADYSDALFTPALRKVDAANAHLTAQMNVVEAELKKAITTGIHTALATEIRAHAKAHKSPMAFISELIVSGDEASVSAVLGAPPYLSGITAQMRDALTEQWNSKRNPALTQKLTLMRAAQDRLDRAAAAFLVNVEKAMGVRYDTVKRLRDAKSAASFG